MWRERLEAFWDGGASLVLGFFGVSDIAGLIAPRYEFVITSCANNDFKSGVTLIDLVDIRTSASKFWVITLPPRHEHVSIRVREGDELLLHLVRENEVVGGEWRLLMTELPQPGRDEFFRIAAVAAATKADRFEGEQIKRSGDRLVWALRQKRQVEYLGRVPAAMRISPSRRVWPSRESSVMIEAVEPVAGRPNRIDTAAFALLDLWQREVPPKVAIRIRVSGTGDDIEASLQRMWVVHVMNQRRHLRDWIRTQRRAGDPIINPLTFEDVRNALDDPDELPNAVDAPHWAALFNLSHALTMREVVEEDGATIRPLPRTASPAGNVAIEMEFFGATLGDDVGIVSNSARDGDIVVYPEDPGGSQKARLLRVGIDGLAAVAFDDNDPVLHEILARAADLEADAAHEPGEVRTTEADARRSSFIALLKSQVRSPALISSIAQARWDDLAPIAVAELACTAAAGGPAAEEVLQRIGGYAAFRLDPVVASIVARRPDLISDIQSELLGERHDTSGHLARRLGVLRGTPQLVAQNLDLPRQIQGWRVLTESGMAQQLTVARISLGGSNDVMAEVGSIVATLTDESQVEERAESLEDDASELKEEEGADSANARDATEKAEGLRNYLRSSRELGTWIALEEAARLTDLIHAGIAHRDSFLKNRVESAPQAAAVADKRGPPQLRADIEARFEQIRAMVPAPAQLATLESEYRDYILPRKPSRRVLRDFEAQLIRLESEPGENKLLDECVLALENWASLPDFLSTIAPRMSHDADTIQSSRSTLLTNYVNRTYPSLPKRDGRGTSFDNHRGALKDSISDRLGLKGRNPVAEANFTKDLLAFADILFFHQSFKAIQGALHELQSRAPSAPTYLIKDGLAHWPRGAAKSWEQAAATLRTYLPQHVEQFEAKIAPPAHSAN